MSATKEFERTLGVPGDDTPRIGDLTEQAAREASLNAEPAAEHLANAAQLIRCAAFLTGEQQRVTIEAANERIARALKAIGERRLIARTPHRSEVAL